MSGQHFTVTVADEEATSPSLRLKVCQAMIDNPHTRKGLSWNSYALDHFRDCADCLTSARALLAVALKPDLSFDELVALRPYRL